ncbi:DUF6461 domain-containing protein [Actinoplanes sp. NPDC024001]|uniref:DUF6461 domain-containing protein n=1 Tax=Actinoplanes sp. NPDC024001 TaxID=3154598 RepID=UPI0033D2A3E6
MVSTVDDYAWLFEGDNGGFLADNYCATLIRRTTSREAVRRIGATVVQTATFPQVTTLEDLEQEAGMSYLAVADVGGNVLILEAFSTVGFERREELSRGTAVASHFMTVNRATRFSYVRDGVTVLDFEPFYGDFRDVADPELATAMREAGFRGPQNDGPTDRYAEAAFALADRLTGAGLTRETLERSTYLHASVPER